MKLNLKSKIALIMCIQAMATLGGCKNLLGFSTATKFGLDVTQRPDQTIDVTLGYDRTEVASIPAPEEQPASDSLNKTKEDFDTYSVLGTFYASYGNPFNPQDPTVIDQMFATGISARVAAQNPYLKNFFGHTAGGIAKEALDAKKSSLGQAPGGD